VSSDWNPTWAVTRCQNKPVRYCNNLEPARYTPHALPCCPSASPRPPPMSIARPMPVLHRASKPIERIDARISAPKRRNSDIYGRSTHGSLGAKMPAIRKARRSDIRAMAESAAAAFMDEELWGNVMHPHRKEYPGDFVLGFERKILRNWHHPRRRFLVGLDRHSGKVVGFAEWERQGILDDPVAPSWVQYLDVGGPARNPEHCTVPNASRQVRP